MHMYIKFWKKRKNIVSSDTSIFKTDEGQPIYVHAYLRICTYAVIFLKSLFLVKNGINEKRNINLGKIYPILKKHLILKEEKIGDPEGSPKD